MENTEANYVVPSGRNKSRKRARNPNNWKRELERNKRYALKCPPKYPACTHNTNALQCRTLRMTDIAAFHRSFYSNRNKVHQDNFILKYCRVKGTARHRPTSGERSAKKITLKYHIKKINGEEIPVCRDTFINILGIKRGRLTGVTTRHGKTSQMAQKNRGGDHVSAKYNYKRKAVQDFIESFRAIESHYCRGHNTVRKYLPDDLNIKKMWRLYNQNAITTLKVRQCFFRNIFNNKYNLGFGSPRTDVCSTCLSLTERIKNEKDKKTKSTLMIEKRVHSLRANAFFGLLREENDDLMTLSFDCQKNLVLPKVPDQVAYYSRQLYMYNFTIVKGSSKTKMTKDNKNERPKGSNEISSAVFNLLTNSHDEISEKNISKLRLVADGCADQNKNITMIGMCSKWLKDHAPNNVKQMEIIFPIVGHSYIPPDRVFGIIEKVLRKKEVISKPEEYISVFSEHAKVCHLGTDFPVLNWKDATVVILKPTGQWHFKFKETKRFILIKTTTNVLIRGEFAYRNDLVTLKSVCMKGKNISMIKADELPGGNNVNELKLRDVGTLLEKHYGSDWKTLIAFSTCQNLVRTGTHLVRPMTSCIILVL